MSMDFARFNATKSAFLLLALILLAGSASATTYYSPYGSDRDEYVQVTVGTHKFQVDGIATNKNTEWYVNNVYQPGENDWSGWLAIDPEYERYISGAIRIKALVYDSDWNYLEYHDWHVTIAKLNTSTEVDNESTVWGASTTVQARLTSGGSGLSGKTMEFYVNNSYCGYATTNSSGYASRTCTAPGYPGSYDIKAEFEGDANYNSSNDIGNWNASKRNSNLYNFYADIDDPCEGDEVCFNVRLRDSDNSNAGISGKSIRFERKSGISWPLMATRTTNSSGYAEFCWTSAVSKAAGEELVDVSVDNVRETPSKDAVEFTVTQTLMDSLGNTRDDSQDWRAKFNGDSYYNGSTSNEDQIVVGESMPTNIDVDNASAKWGMTVQLAAYLEETEGVNSPLPSKQLRFQVDGVTKYATTNSVGWAYVNYTTPSPPNNYIIAVSFDGDPGCGYEASSETGTLTSQKRSSNLYNFSADIDDPCEGDEVCFSVWLRDTDNGNAGISGRSVRFERKYLLTWPLIDERTTDGSGRAVFCWTSAVSKAAGEELVDVSVDNVRETPSKDAVEFTVTQTLMDSLGNTRDDSQDWRAKFNGDSYYNGSTSNEDQIVVGESMPTNIDVDNASAKWGMTVQLAAYLEETEGVNSPLPGKQLRFQVDGVTKYATTNSVGWAYVNYTTPSSPGNCRRPLNNHNPTNRRNRP